MPIYEYRCADCGFQKEFLQKMSDAPLTDCPECGKASLGKMVTAAGFHLKGSGWYVTDFKQSSKPKADVAGKAGAKVEGKAAADTGAADSKPAADKPAADTASKKSETSSTASASTGAAATSTAASSTPASSTPARNN